MGKGRYLSCLVLFLVILASLFCYVKVGRYSELGKVAVWQSVRPKSYLKGNDTRTHVTVIFNDYCGRCKRLGPALLRELEGVEKDRISFYDTNPFIYGLSEGGVPDYLKDAYGLPSDFQLPYVVVSKKTDKGLKVITSFEYEKGRSFKHLLE